LLSVDGTPGDEPARVLEIISPAGLDELFRELGALGDALDPDTMATFAARYGGRPASQP
jgi:hypothetical protein